MTNLIVKNYLASYMYKEFLLYFLKHTDWDELTVIHANINRVWPPSFSRLEPVIAFISSLLKNKNETLDLVLPFLVPL